METKSVIVNAKLNNGNFPKVLSEMKKLPEGMGMQFLGARGFSNNGAVNHTVFFNKNGVSNLPSRNPVSKIGLIYGPKTDVLKMTLEHSDQIDAQAVLGKAKAIITKYGELLD